MATCLQVKRHMPRRPVPSNLFGMAKSRRPQSLCPPGDTVPPSRRTPPTSARIQENNENDTRITSRLICILQRSVRNLPKPQRPPWVNRRGRPGKAHAPPGRPGGKSAPTNSHLFSVIPRLFPAIYIQIRSECRLRTTKAPTVRGALRARPINIPKQ